MANLNTIANAYARRINRGSIQKEDVPEEIINHVENALEEMKAREEVEIQNNIEFQIERGYMEDVLSI